MTVNEYNRCVDEHADHLYRFILKSVKDKDAARDILQDTYEKLWRKVSDVESTNAKSYMFTTAYRTMMDYFRANKKSVSLDGSEEFEPAHNKQYSDVKEILNEGLSRLPEIQRTVILLRDYEGYDYKEIGQITELTESQVKVYIFRARQFLKNFIVNPEFVV